eukprot:TRINITY_DN8621_c0_g1_i11.p2 TRINITY_DN8621_c0_g1~~TRINITY_DN8621_c0_g1_i11.p2  ORF type:complete len:152 (+),score=43.45 TRINITY_DN8621_c0_g1_i11:152-607(+)
MRVVYAIIYLIEEDSVVNDVLADAIASNTEVKGSEPGNYVFVIIEQAPENQGEVKVEEAKKEDIKEDVKEEEKKKEEGVQMEQKQEFKEEPKEEQVSASIGDEPANNADEEDEKLLEYALSKINETEVISQPAIGNHSTHAEATCRLRNGK